jgi:hypothetical protein
VIPFSDVRNAPAGATAGSAPSFTFVFLDFLSTSLRLENAAHQIDDQQDEDDHDEHGYD